MSLLSLATGDECYFNPLLFVVVADENGLFYPDNAVDFMDTWRQFERLYERGVVKSIGVSNFNTSQLQRLLEEGSIKPEVNQIESHPHFNNDDLVQFCQQNDIHVTGMNGGFEGVSSEVKVTRKNEKKMRRVKGRGSKKKRRKKEV